MTDSWGQTAGVGCLPGSPMDERHFSDDGMLNTELRHCDSWLLHIPSACDE